MAEPRRPLLLLVNPAAGGKPAAPTSEREPLSPEALRDVLANGGVDVELQILREADEPGKLAAPAVAAGRDVAVAGGDGTVRPVAAALVGTDATLGVIPRGSWNNIATGWDLPKDEREAAEVIVAGGTSQVDVGLAWHPGPDEHDPEKIPEDAAVFFEAAGVGLDAAGFGVAEVGARYGIWRAARAGWRVLRRRRTPMILVVDGRRLRTNAPAVTACNGPFYGFGFALAADADASDGLLDVVVFSDMSTVDVLRHYLAAARNHPSREPRVRELSARWMRVDGASRSLPAHADGESRGTTPVAFAVGPKRLRVFAARQGQLPGNPVAAAASAPKTRS